MLFPSGDAFRPVHCGDHVGFPCQQHQCESTTTSITPLFPNTLETLKLARFAGEMRESLVLSLSACLPTLNPSSRPVGILQKASLSAHGPQSARLSAVRSCIVFCHNDSQTLVSVPPSNATLRFATIRRCRRRRRRCYYIEPRSIRATERIDLSRRRRRRKSNTFVATAVAICKKYICDCKSITTMACRRSNNTLCAHNFTHI